MSIAMILQGKSGNVLSVRPEATIAEVARTLAEHRIGAVLVRDEKGRMAGIVSERDVVRSLVPNGAATLEMTADQLMTRVLHTVSRDTALHDAMEIMTNGRVRHLPVLEGEALVGLVSIGDVVKQLLDKQAQEVDQLREYVSGRS